MDIDDIEEIHELTNAESYPEGKGTPNRGKIVVVDDDHPFDLDAFLSNYTGNDTC